MNSINKLLNIANNVTDSDITSAEIAELINPIEKFREKLEKKNTYSNDIYIKIDRLLLLCKSLIREGETVLENWVYGNAFLKDDFFNAYSVLEEFKQKMNSDIKMKQFGSLHKKISHYLNRLYETGKVENGDLNGESIEFLLKMYYNYKLQNVGSKEVQP